MELNPIEVNLSAPEKIEVIKHTLKQKMERLEDVERKIRELKREDAEMAFLAGIVGAEYINPANQSNAADLVPLDQERQLLGYIIGTLEAKLVELSGGKPTGIPARAAPKVPKPLGQPGVQPRSGRNMWG